MDLEAWLFKLLEDIEKASEKDEEYDLHLDLPAVDEITEAFHNMRWFDIY
jgi:hypothetical protein